MERPELKTVIEGLQEQGYRTGRAFPGERMPHIQKPAVAVALQKEESGSQTLAVTVLYPENMGGGACEDDARVVAGYLRGMGFECVQERCQYDGKSDRFFVRILATWEDVQADAPYTVSVGESLMRYTTGFRAELKRSETWDEESETTVEHVTWALTLEEMIPRGAEEPEEPAAEGEETESPETGSEETGEKALSPGMRYQHYAPKGQVTLVEGCEDTVIRALRCLHDQAEADQLRACVMCFTEHLDALRDCHPHDIGSRDNPDEVAQRLFDIQTSITSRTMFLASCFVLRFSVPSSSLKSKVKSVFPPIASRLITWASGTIFFLLSNSSNRGER